MTELVTVYYEDSGPCRAAKLSALVLELLVALTERHATLSDRPRVSPRSLGIVKAAVRFIRENTDRRLSLDEIARAVCADKFALCRAFKRFTGYTLVEYSSLCRCQQAADHLAAGDTVAEAAAKCGFDNLSFFTKTFKRYMGALPSDYKHH